MLEPARGRGRGRAKFDGNRAIEITAHERTSTHDTRRLLKPPQPPPISFLYRDGETERGSEEKSSISLSSYLRRPMNLADNSTSTTPRSSAMDNNEDNYESKEGNGGKTRRSNLLTRDQRSRSLSWLLPSINLRRPCQITVSLIPIIQLDAPLPAPFPPPHPRGAAIHLCANLFTNHVRKLRRIPGSPWLVDICPRVSSLNAPRNNPLDPSAPFFFSSFLPEKRSIIPLRFL